ncbi:Him, partial [Drosophila busckii]
MDLSMATKCKVQAAIKQRQQQRLEEQEQQHPEQQQQQQEDALAAEQQLQQLCRFLAENAARKKRQRLKHNYALDSAQPLLELPTPPAAANSNSNNTHDMDMLMAELHSCHTSVDTAMELVAPPTAAAAAAAPRDSILLKIRHQIFERKRQRQRQLAELMQQRLVVWRP